MQNSWIVQHAAKADAHCRLVCLPYAGAGAVAYADWQRRLPAWVDVWAVELPGRLSRIREPAITSIREIVVRAFDGIRPLLDRPYALFGHSMGAVLAFELARRNRAEGGTPVSGLIIGARNAPHKPRLSNSLHRLDDSRFIRALGKHYEPIAPALLEDAEMRELVIRILRADMEAIETYQYQSEPALDCPIAVCGGRDDPSTDQTKLEAWSDHTRGEFNLRMFEGGHFFLKTELQPVLEEVTECLRRGCPLRGVEHSDPSPPARKF